MSSLIRRFGEAIDVGIVSVIGALTAGDVDCDHRDDPARANGVVEVLDRILIGVFGLVQAVKPVEDGITFVFERGGVVVGRR